MTIILGTITKSEVILSSDTKVTNLQGSEKRLQKIYEYNLLNDKIICAFGGMLDFLFPLKKELDNISNISSIITFADKLSELCNNYYDKSKNKFGGALIEGFIKDIPSMYLLTQSNKFKPILCQEIGQIAFLPPVGIEAKKNWMNDYETELYRLSARFPNNIQRIFKELQKWFADNDTLNTCNYEQHYVVLNKQREILSKLY